MKNPIHQPIDERLALAKEFERLAHTAGGPGLSLGVWAGRGAWASMPQPHKDAEGQRALADLDRLIERLAAFRGHLAERIDGEVSR